MIQKHIEALLAGALAILFCLGFVSYQQEHNDRIQAEQTIKDSQAKVAALMADSQAKDAAAKANAVLKK